MRTNNFSPVQEAECEKSAMAVKYNTDTKIEDNSRMYKLQEANFDREINTVVSDHLLLYCVPHNSMCIMPDRRPHSFRLRSTSIFYQYQNVNFHKI